MNPIERYSQFIQGVSVYGTPFLLYDENALEPYEVSELASYCNCQGINLDRGGDYFVDNNSDKAYKNLNEVLYTEGDGIYGLEGFTTGHYWFDTIAYHYLNNGERALPMLFKREWLADFELGGLEDLAPVNPEGEISTSWQVKEVIQDYNQRGFDCVYKSIGKVALPFVRRRR